MCSMDVGTSISIIVVIIFCCTEFMQEREKSTNRGKQMANTRLLLIHILSNLFWLLCGSDSHWQLCFFHA